jgi:hypothetical protein
MYCYAYTGQASDVWIWKYSQKAVFYTYRVSTCVCVCVCVCVQAIKSSVNLKSFACFHQL